MHLGVFCIHLAAIFKRHGAVEQTSRAILTYLCHRAAHWSWAQDFCSSCNPFRSCSSKAQRWPLVSKPAAASCIVMNFGVGWQPLKTQRAQVVLLTDHSYRFAAINMEPCFNTLLCLSDISQRFQSDSITHNIQSLTWGITLLLFDDTSCLL